ncbi:putative nuclease HARBI1 [Anthonomus grandis grandis]|uniref:putative nuclease HARBI1 n=1 Tax=Anthonomus grandis grandis TaxID=2921223 RepID=UPI002166B15D|nr:putative nuclease HARBI1 [Anthonomus grandis grandis]
MWCCRWNTDKYRCPDYRRASLCRSPCANWPGSVHDARVLRNSNLFRRMENAWRPHPNLVILGDSAYPLKQWLIPPTSENPLNQAQQDFNRAHKRTRRVIENAFGILKEKFPCLNYLRVSPVFAANVFKYCATLCNISKGDGDADDFMVDDGEW